MLCAASPPHAAIHPAKDLKPDGARIPCVPSFHRMKRLIETREMNVLQCIGSYQGMSEAIVRTIGLKLILDYLQDRKLAELSPSLL